MMENEGTAKVTKWDRIRWHVQEHKEAYIVGGIGIGAVLTTYLVMRSTSVPEITNTVAPTIAPVFNNDNSSVVNFGGTMSKIVKRLEDDKIWETMTDRAKEIANERGITQDRAMWLLSRNANGYEPHVYGEHYQIIGLRTAG